MIFDATGIMQYGPAIRAAVMVDQGIVDFYRSLCPKYYYVKPQMYPAHITVVRFGKELPSNMKVWGKYNLIEFSYSNEIQHDSKYFYLNVYSEMIGNIREELGLPRFRSDKNCYHITIGNTKS